MNYVDTFILVADDCPVGTGVAPTSKPGKAPTIHARQYALMAGEPYCHTQEDILFFVHADRNALSRNDAEGRAKFFEKSHACLRASALPKKYGWGVHFDGKGKAALYARDSAEYHAYATGQVPGITLVKAMRNKRV